MELNQDLSLLDRTGFARAWAGIGGADVGAFEALEMHYAESYRAYHNFEHIAECLGWLRQVWDFAERPDELAVAIFFHDAIYEPGSLDNEATSASFFRGFAAAAGVERECIERVVGLIESTAHHAEVRGDAALLADIDLSIIGASPTRYRRYEEDIRREYAAVPDVLYRAGRARVLMGFLERLEIYRTPYFAGRLEAQARSNLSAALSALGAYGGR